MLVKKTDFSVIQAILIDKNIYDYTFWRRKKHVSAAFVTKYLYMRLFNDIDLMLHMRIHTENNRNNANFVTRLFLNASDSA